MKSSTLFLFAVAVAVLIGVLGMVTRQAATTPADFFAAVKKRMSEGVYDREQSIQNLDSVLERAIDAGDTKLAGQVQLLRGRTLMELGAFDRARADLSAVAAMYPADVTVENDLVDLEARSGDFHAAVQRVERLLAANPGNGGAYVRLGRLHLAAADRAVKHSHELLSRSLVPDKSERARELLEHSSALYAADPKRVALGYELRGLLASADDPALEEATNGLDSACLEIEAARNALTQSLAHGVDAEALALLIDLYVRSGHSEFAVDLATTTIQRPEVRDSATFARALMRALKGLGRWNFAADIAKAWIDKKAPMNGDFAEQCCEALWYGKRYAYLHLASQVMLGFGTTSQAIASNLYLGLAIVELGGFQDGRQYLQTFLATDDPDPFPGARAIAWQHIARASRELGQPVPERTALQGQVELEPELEGEAWLRLAELQMASPHGGYRIPEMRFARGMSLMPERTAELFKRWDEIGVLELRSVGLDIEAVRADLAHRKIYTPSPEASSYELYRLAEVHLEQGDTSRAGAHVKRLLDLVPGFVPGLDLAIRIADVEGDKRERMSWLIQRVQRAGRTPAIDAILREIPLGELDTKDLLALMRADPDRSGRLWIADDLARANRPNQALALVEKLGLESLGEEGQLLVARLLLARREPEYALRILKALGSSLFSLPDGIELYVRAGVGAQDHTALIALSANMAGQLVTERRADGAGFLDGTTRPLEPRRVLKIVDDLLAAGEGDAALPLIEALDSIPRLRGGDVLSRLIACAVMRGAFDEAHTALDRAQAFDTKGSAEFAALMLSALEGRTDDLRAEAAALSKTTLPLTPLARAQVALLAERFEEARTLLDANTAPESNDDPWWNLTRYAASLLEPRAKPFELAPFLGHGATDAARVFFTGTDGKADARIALAWICSARLAPGVPFARAFLMRSELAASQSSLWTEWIRAALDARSGLEARSLATIARLHTLANDFGPAWKLESGLLDATERTDAERLDLRNRTAAALGPLAGDPVSRKLDEVRAAETFDSLPAALTLARELVTREPTSIAASVELSRIHTRMGNPIEALSTLHATLTARAARGQLGIPPPANSTEPDLVLEYLDAIRHARHAPGNPVSPQRASGLVEALIARIPDDPRPVLAGAEIDLELDPRNPTFGVTRAYSRLERFRDAHKGQSLERLGRGSVASWARFYSNLEPARARAFVEAELALAPALLPAWTELALALEAGGDEAGALRALQTAARLSPEGPILREILRIRGRNALTGPEIEELAKQILAAEGKRTPDPELLLESARSYMNISMRGHERAIAILEMLTGRKDLSATSARELALLTATSLMTRGKPEDLPKVRAALDSIALVDLDPYTASFVTALRGVAAQ